MIFFPCVAQKANAPLFFLVFFFLLAACTSAELDRRETNTVYQSNVWPTAVWPDDLPFPMFDLETVTPTSVPSPLGWEPQAIIQALPRASQVQPLAIPPPLTVSSLPIPPPLEVPIPVPSSLLLEQEIAPEISDETDVDRPSLGILSRSTTIPTGRDGAPVFLEFQEGTSDFVDREQAYTTLSALMNRLNTTPHLRLVLRAYASDNVSDDLLSARRLSLTRAQKIRQFFTDQGLRFTRITIQALGHTDSDGSADRVEIQIIQ